MLAQLFLSAAALLAAASAATEDLQSKKGPLTFFFYGDWGHNVPANVSESGIAYEEVKVANAVAQKAAEVHPSFFVMLGDNFYENGVASVNDPLWQAYYKSVYSAPSTEVPWYLILGNHDYYGLHTPLAQVDYTTSALNSDSRWNLPDNFYTKIFNVPNSDKTLQIFFVDTVLLAPNGASPAKTGLPPANADGSTSDVQMLLLKPYLNLVEQQLQMSTADYKIVAGHYHIYTVTDGDDTTPELVTYLVPLMQKYGVQAYMNGHEHNAEHIYFNGIHYITVGHGCDKDDPIAAQPWTQTAALTGTIVGPTAEGVRFAQDVGSFGVMEVTDAAMSFYIVDENGNTIYDAVIASSGARRNLRG